MAEAGCDDATIGIGLRGRIALDFAREADTAREAIVSAAHAVRQAIPGAQLVSGAHQVPGAALPEELESLFV